MEKEKSKYIEPLIVYVTFDDCDIITASVPVSGEDSPPDIGNMDDAWGY